MLWIKDNSQCQPDTRCLPRRAPAVLSSRTLTISVPPVSAHSGSIQSLHTHRSCHPAPVSVRCSLRVECPFYLVFLASHHLCISEGPHSDLVHQAFPLPLCHPLYPQHSLASFSSDTKHSELLIIHSDSLRGCHHHHKERQDTSLFLAHPPSRTQHVQG